MTIPSGIIFRIGIVWALLSFINWLESRLKIDNPKNQLASWLGLIVRPAILIGAIIYFIDRLSSLSTVGLITIGNLFNTDFVIANIFLLSVGLYLILVTSRALAALMAYLMQVVLKTSDQSRKILEPLFQYLIVAIGFVTLALLAGVQGNTFLVISGSIGVGLGFGLKDTLGNLFSGIYLLLEGAIKPGEILMIEKEPCRVISLGLRVTTLSRQRDDAELLIPNQVLFATQAESFTAGENYRRESVVVGAAYHHDPQQVISLLEQIAQSHKRVLNKPAAQAFAIDFADSSITYKLKFSVRNPLEALNVGSELRQQIWSAFEENNITIPFPQRQVYPMEWPPKDENNLQLTGGRSVMTEREQPEATGSSEKDPSQDKPQRQQRQ
ncbi:mechanosensitive ion channel family protein [Synechococcus sp. UW179A]|uniref:mechanosensitive ion channel family protein n=1 Tax=Synechococcus sp. UW179A TaxID=2575510 RepID=UPI001FCA7527|nr:mechanosensitive ion channel domain-containing protein [Synechococcus sp. UW179A]